MGCDCATCRDEAEDEDEIGGARPEWLIGRVGGCWLHFLDSLLLSLVSRLQMCLVLALLFNVFLLSAWKFRKDK